MNPAELNRQLINLLQIGTIESVNTVDKTCRVQIGELTTGDLDMPAEIGRNFVRWQPLRVGTQVLLASPGGDISAGVIVAKLYSNDLTPPTTAETDDVIAFDDGTTVSYNSESHRLSIDCTGPVEIACTDASISAGGNAAIQADGNATVEAGGDANIKGATVTLQDGAAGGVVCQSHVCAFTGSPHPQSSLTVTGGN